MRYARQIGLPQIGEEGQERLRRARVLLVGVGGLGSPIAQYLVGAGVGCLGLVEHDTVSLNNLHRQVLYTETDVGKLKVSCAVERLHALNGEVRLDPYACRITAENAAEIIGRYDFVMDGCDNYATRYVIDDAASTLQKPYLYGAICGFEGQVALFHTKENPYRYRDLWPEMPPPPADKSLVGMLPAVIGGVMAHEALKLICGYGDPLIGRLWTFDLLSLQSYCLRLVKAVDLGK